MTTDTERPAAGGPQLDEPISRLTTTSRRVPGWALLALLLGCGVVVAGLLSLGDGFNLGLLVAGTVVLYTVAVYLTSRLVEGARKATDRLVTTVVTSAFAIAMIPLFSLLYTVVDRGWARMDAEFFNSSMRNIIGPGGGIYHALAGTLIITALATLVAVPLGILTAIYLVEYGQGRLAKTITFFVDVMSGIPSIVAGLFAVALFSAILGPGARLGISGAVALAVLMTPIVVRSVEEMLKIVPNELREASYALGVSRWRTIVKVVLPTAVAGIASGVTLAIARVVGETAPLLVTVGYTTGVNLNPFDGQMASLPYFAYSEYRSPGIPPQPSFDRVWAAALVLIVIVMTLSIVARLVARLFAPKSR